MKWKNRLTNYNFWISIVSAVLLILQAFDFEYDIAYVNEIATAVLGLLVVIGIINDPTKSSSSNTENIASNSDKTTTESVVELDNNVESVIPNNEEIKGIDNIVSTYDRLNYTNFAKMVNSVASLFKDKTKEITTIKNISKAYLEVKKVKSNIDNNIKELETIPSIYVRKTKEKETYHKDSMTEKTEKELKLLEIGRNIHTLFERIDFINNKLPYIEDNYYQEKLTNFLNSAFMKKYEDYKKYQEYEFIYENSNKIYHGKIDLLLVGDKEALIIDYKLKNTKDKAYLDQLEGYKEAISKKLDLSVSCYLYSIIDEIFVKVC